MQTENKNETATVSQNGRLTHKVSKTDALLVRLLWGGSAVDTDEGTSAQWAHLERCGYVEKNTRSGRGLLGHYFSRRITELGRERIRQLIADEDAYLLATRRKTPQEIDDEKAFQIGQD